MGERRSSPGAMDLKDRIEPRDDVVLAADHEAVAPLESPDAAARAAVDVVQPALGELPGAIDVVLVVGVASVDHDVVGLEELDQFIERVLGDRRGQHEPDGARRLELGRRGPASDDAPHNAFAGEGS